MPSWVKYVGIGVGAFVLYKLFFADKNQAGGAVAMPTSSPPLSSFAPPAPVPTLPSANEPVTMTFSVRG